MKQHMRLAGIGPIVEADLEFGDLTVLVGPQAGLAEFSAAANAAVAEAAATKRS